MSSSTAAPAASAVNPAPTPAAVMSQARTESPRRSVQRLRSTQQLPAIPPYPAELAAQEAAAALSPRHTAAAANSSAQAVTQHMDASFNQSLPNVAAQSSAAYPLSSESALTSSSQFLQPLNTSQSAAPNSRPALGEELDDDPIYDHDEAEQAEAEARAAAQRRIVGAGAHIQKSGSTMTDLTATAVNASAIAALEAQHAAAVSTLTDELRVVQSRVPQAAALHAADMARLQLAHREELNAMRSRQLAENRQWRERQTQHLADWWQRNQAELQRVAAQAPADVFPLRIEPPPALLPLNDPPSVPDSGVPADVQLSTMALSLSRAEATNSALQDHLSDVERHLAAIVLPSADFDGHAALASSAGVHEPHHPPPASPALLVSLQGLLAARSAEVTTLRHTLRETREAAMHAANAAADDADMLQRCTAGAQADVQRLEAEVQQLQSAFDQITQERSALASSLKEAQRSRDEHAAAREQSESSCALLTTSLQEAEAARAELVTLLEQAQTSLEQAHTALAAAASSARTAEESRVQAVEQVALQQREQAAAHEAWREKHKKQFEFYEQNYAALEKKFDEAEAARVRDAQTMQDALSASEASKEELRLKLEAELAESKSVAEAAAAAASAASVEAARLHGEAMRAQEVSLSAVHLQAMQAMDATLTALHEEQMQQLQHMCVSQLQATQQEKAALSRRAAIALCLSVARTTRRSTLAHALSHWARTHLHLRANDEYVKGLKHGVDTQGALSNQRRHRSHLSNSSSAASIAPGWHAPEHTSSTAQNSVATSSGNSPYPPATRVSPSAAAPANLATTLRSASQQIGAQHLTILLDRMHNTSLGAALRTWRQATHRASGAVLPHQIPLPPDDENPQMTQPSVSIVKTQESMQHQQATILTPALPLPASRPPDAVSRTLQQAPTSVLLMAAPPRPAGHRFHAQSRPTAHATVPNALWQPAPAHSVPASPALSSASVQDAVQSSHAVFPAASSSAPVTPPRSASPARSAQPAPAVTSSSISPAPLSSQSNAPSSAPNLPPLQMPAHDFSVVRPSLEEGHLSPSEQSFRASLLAAQQMAARFLETRPDGTVASPNPTHARHLRAASASPLQSGSFSNSGAPASSMQSPLAADLSISRRNGPFSPADNSTWHPPQQHHQRVMSQPQHVRRSVSPQQRRHSSRSPSARGSSSAARSLQDPQSHAERTALATSPPQPHRSVAAPPVAPANTGSSVGSNSSRVQQQQALTERLSSGVHRLTQASIAPSPASASVPVTRRNQAVSPAAAPAASDSKSRASKANGVSVKPFMRAAPAIAPSAAGPSAHATVAAAPSAPRASRSTAPAAAAAAPTSRSRAR